MWDLEPTSCCDEFNGCWSCYIASMSLMVSLSGGLTTVRDKGTT